MDLRSVLREKWRYKIAALLLSTLLWINVTADKRTDQPVPTRLSVQVRDTSWVLIDAPSEVHTVFQGRSRDLLALRLDNPVLPVPVDSVTGPTMTVDLSRDWVLYDHELEVRPTGITPGQVELRFEPRVERKVAVVPDLELTAASGYAIVRPLIVQPESVTIRGGQSRVGGVLRAGTRKVTQDDMQHAFTWELNVLLPAGDEGLDLDPPTVLVTVEVDSLVVRQIDVPVVARGSGAGGVVLSPATVQVKLRGPWRSVRTAMESIHSATVLVDGRLERPAALPVTPDLPDGLTITAASSPSEVLVSPRSRGG